MKRRSLMAAWMVGMIALAAACPAAEKTPEKQTGPAIRYLPLDAPAGMSQAVVVEGLPLVYTRQFLPLDREGKLVGEGSSPRQIEQVLDNLAAVLTASGSGLDRLVRLNIYALTPETVDETREALAKRLPASVRPAIGAVLTPLPHPKALVAVDAVAAETGTPPSRSDDPVAKWGFTVGRYVVGGAKHMDVAVLPRGGVAYLSGVGEEGNLTVSPVARSMDRLMRTLAGLKLSPVDVVQIKVFLKPATAADEVLEAMAPYFREKYLPPVVFVEWISPLPVEIEIIARLPLEGRPGPVVEYYNPPDLRPLHSFSRAALVRSQRQIFISGLYAREAAKPEAQANDVFQHLQEILDAAGGDMRHLVKATYYVCDDDSARGIDRVRPRYFDQQHPPAASKVMVHGAGRPQRTLTMDMIAAGLDSSPEADPSRRPRP